MTTVSHAVVQDDGVQHLEDSDPVNSMLLAISIITDKRSSIICALVHQKHALLTDFSSELVLL